MTKGQRISGTVGEHHAAASRRCKPVGVVCPAGERVRHSRVRSKQRSQLFDPHPVVVVCCGNRVRAVGKTPVRISAGGAWNLPVDCVLRPAQGGCVSGITERITKHDNRGISLRPCQARKKSEHNERDQQTETRTQHGTGHSTAPAMERETQTCANIRARTAER